MKKKILLIISLVIITIVVLIGLKINNKYNYDNNYDYGKEIIIDMNSNEGIEYSTKIIEYLKNKYGANNKFEILTIKKEKRGIATDGVGNGKIEYITAWYEINANILDKNNNILFEAGYSEMIFGYNGEKEKIHYGDNLEEMLITQEEINLRISKARNEFWSIDNNIGKLSLGYQTNNSIASKEYGKIPSVTDIIIDIGSIDIGYNNQIINENDIINHIKSYLKQYINILNKNNLKCTRFKIKYYRNKRDRYKFKL